MRKLPKDKSSAVNLTDEIALEYYTTKKTFDGSVSLQPGEPSTPLPPVKYSGGKAKDENADYLSTIIEKLNKRFGTDFTLADQLSVEQIKEDFALDEDMVNRANNNSIEDFQYAFQKAFMGKVVDRMDQNQKFYMKVLDDSQFAKALMDMMMVEVYDRLNQIAR